MNPDLHLPRFVKCRVDRIFLMASADGWRYVNTSLIPADVGMGVGSVKRSGSTYSGFADLTCCCREAWSLNLQFLQSQCIGPALVETHC